ncbi:transposase [Streptomyces sp. NPDC101393]|uniref:transposase n=1 Tax=Streptomyces sp. NPDC101393 TaxID=3366141 RepID=UPI00382240C2
MSSDQGALPTTKAVRVSLLLEAAVGAAFTEASRFRDELHACLTVRSDKLFELADAVLCAPGAVRSAVEWTLLPEQPARAQRDVRRLNRGRIDTGRLRSLLDGLPARLPLSRSRTAVRYWRWTSRRGFVRTHRVHRTGGSAHVHGRAKTTSQFIPGWPYSIVAVLETGATSWTQALDTVRLCPSDDATAVTAAELRDVVEQLIASGHWQPSDPDIVIVTHAGSDVTRPAWILRDLPVELIGRIRGDRVMRLPKPLRIFDPKEGRPQKHGPEFRFAQPETWPDPAVTTRTGTAKYGKAVTQGWDRAHPRLTHRVPGWTTKVNFPWLR